ncbi:6-phosphogluconate dehydrogenase, decarboxylating [Plecturocebus cupreus]
MWRREAAPSEIKDAFHQHLEIENLLLGNLFKLAAENCQDCWWQVVSTGVQASIPMPCFTTAVCFRDGYRHEMLPANLIQTQWDYFGAHTYECLEKLGQLTHTN